MWLYILLGLFLLLLVLVYFAQPVHIRRLELKGSHVLITGGSSGIGLSVAKLLAQKEGVGKITLLARNKEKLERAKKEIQAENDKVEVFAVSVDVATYSDVEEALSKHIESNGDVDVLIPSAGLTCPFLFPDTPMETHERNLRVNYLGTLNVIKVVLPSMVKRNKGSIMLVSSIAGQLGVPGYTSYSPSKFALKGLAECLYHELIPYDNVSIGICYPPNTDTPMLEEEQRVAPDITRKIADSAGTLKPEKIAQKIITAIKSRQFSVFYSMDGLLMGTATLGNAPSSGILEGLLSVLLPPIVRLFLLIQVHREWRGLVMEEHQNRSANKKKQ